MVKKPHHFYPNAKCNMCILALGISLASSCHLHQPAFGVALRYKTLTAMQVKEYLPDKRFVIGVVEA